VEPVVAKFRSHEEAAEADRAYYRQLTPAQRLELQQALIELAHPDFHAQRLQRVYRIVELESR
jgi:acyl-CoA hydrolase